MANPLLHRYIATVRRIIDGDTIAMDVDLGFHVFLHDQTFRLAGINAREKNEPGGAEALTNLQQLLPPGTPCILSSIKNDKYGGRYIATIMKYDGTSINTRLIETGWAAEWSGSGAKPVPPWPRTDAGVEW